MLLVKVGPVNSSWMLLPSDAVQRPGRAVGLGLCIPVRGVVVRQHLRVELERRVDIAQRREEAAVIELGQPRRIHHQDVELALAGAHRVALLLGAPGERVHVQRDLVAGLLLIRLDRLRKPAEPRRLVDDDGDRRDLLREGGPARKGQQRAQADAAGDLAELRFTPLRFHALLLMVLRCVSDSADWNRDGSSAATPISS
jgi:hypothetical protein